MVQHHLKVGALVIGSFGVMGAAAQAELAYSGDIGVSITSSDIFNSDDSENATLNGYALSGTARVDMDRWVGFADFNISDRDIKGNNFDQFAPEGAKSLGLHFGYQFDSVYVGAFAGKNWFQGDDASSANGYEDGELYGIEAEYEVSSNVRLFAQLGDADMVGDQGDTAFKGQFVRAGLSATQGKLTVATDFEYGRSDNIFEDNGDWGEYTAFGINAEYQFKPRLIGTFGLSRMDITANTEDKGDETLISIGVKVPFGANYKRNNLTTTYRPGLAAAWAETLD